MYNNKYEEQFRDFLLHRLTQIRQNIQKPWIKVTDEPLLDGDFISYSGINLLLLTDYCRNQGIRERIFCTYQQKLNFGNPVWRNEKGFYIKESNGRGLYVFPCRKTRFMDSNIIFEEYSKHIELLVQFRELKDSRRIYSTDDVGICKMIYDTVYNNQLIKDNLNKLV